MVRRYLTAIIATLVFVGGFGALVFLSSAQTDEVTIISTLPDAATDENWWQPLCKEDPAKCAPPTAGDPPNDPTSSPADPKPCILRKETVCTPEVPGNQIGKAFVTIRVHFTDGTEKVITSEVSLLTVSVEGKEVARISYDVEVQFDGLGDVAISNLKWGSFIVPASGAGTLISPGAENFVLTAPAGARIKIVQHVVEASEIEAFLVSARLADGDYVLRFYTSFMWVGTSVVLPLSTGGPEPAFGAAGISGPDIPVTITLGQPCLNDKSCLP